MTQGQRDIVSGSVLLAASLGLLLAIPSQVVTTEGDSLTPAFMPTLMTVCIAVLAAVLLVQGMLTRRRGGGEAETAGRPVRRWLAIGATAAVIAGQTALLPYAGYLASAAASVALLALLYGLRRWWQVLALALLAPPAIQLFFRYTMLVLLPEGSWLG